MRLRKEKRISTQDYQWLCSPLRHGESVMNHHTKLLEEIGVYSKKLIDHFFGYGRHNCTMFINIYPPLRRLAVKSVDNIAKVQFRVVDLQPNQGELSVSHHLSLRKVMDAL
jgi:hypothetical protein